VKLLAIIEDTFREAISRKVFIFFFGISSFVILLFLAFFSLSSVEGMIEMMKLSEDKDSVRSLIVGIQVFIIGPLYAGGLFLSIFSASSFIPNMLEKGTIDLLLSKPISRVTLLTGKFLGGTLIVFLNVAYLISAIWLMINLKFGTLAGAWHLEFLSTIVLITYIFMIFYILMMFIGILTQSSIFAMIISYLVFFIFSPILAYRENITTSLVTSTFGKILVNFFYYIFPQTSELGSITLDLAAGVVVNSWMPLITTTIWGIVMFSVTVFIFQRKNF
jgi:ABC-type transport system involved in multi-copper enzyme maturation permease subunit